MKKSSGLVKILIILVAIVITLLGYIALTAPDRRTAGEKIGDAIDQLPEGLDKAMRQLDDRSLGEKLGEQVQDMGDAVGDSIKRQTEK